MNNNTFTNNNSKYLLITSKEINNNNLSDFKNVYASNIKDKKDAKVNFLLNDKSCSNNKDLYELENLISNKNLSKHTSSSTKQWANSVYSYNKNYTKNLPIARNVINNLLNSYFNITSLINGKKSNSNVLVEKRNSLNKTLVSKAEVKITNDKINLTVYIYNRNKETLLRNIRKNKKIVLKKRLLKGKILLKRMRYIKLIIKAKNKIIKSLAENKDLKGLYCNVKALHININNIFKNYVHKHLFTDFYYNDLKKNFFFYYQRILIINNNKFKNWFLSGLKKTISNLYNKNVKLNIINQKYFYLNSDHLTKAIATRVRNRNNRIIIEIKKTLSRIPLASCYTDSYSRNINLKVNNLRLINNALKKKIFASIRYKHIQGIRIQGAGRLSRRLTAARSLTKRRYIGNLQNTQWIYFNKNYSLLRGNAKPNVQYTNLNSKTRNGAFGLKGWVNSN